MASKPVYGISIMYIYVPHGKCSEIITIVPSGCGGVITASRGIITSPGYDSVAYPNYQLCRWNISEPNGMRMELKFEGFMMADDMDFVEVRLIFCRVMSQTQCDSYYPLYFCSFSHRKQLIGTSQQLFHFHEAAINFNRVVLNL